VSAKTHKLVTLGRISGLFGVKGWVKVHSYTNPRDNVVSFTTWTLKSRGGERRYEVETGHAQGAGVVAKLRGLDDREHARELIGAEIIVERGELPECAPGEYYWMDLEGLEVRNLDGRVLGTIDHLMSNGGHDIMVLAGEPQRLIPFVHGRVIHEVDLAAGRVVADWPWDF